MKRHIAVDLLIFILIGVFLFSFLTPKYIFSLSTATGGDMGSHYPAAVYLKQVLMPAGKIMGWDQGCYAGYPLFYHYFPLPFIIMALISFAIPMQIAFKLVTILGTLMLPVCTYFALRVMKFKFPIPILGAMFTLAFLFNEGNSMWGGNILSTLAGEFSYSLSLALMVLLSGTLYAGVVEDKWRVWNATLVFLIGFSHGFTLVFSCVMAVFFVMCRRDFWKNFKYLFHVFGLGGLLLAFWIVPFFFNLPYVNAATTKWVVAAWREYVPQIFWPFIAVAGLSLVLNVFDRRVRYLAYIIASSVALYFVGSHLGMLDIRFVPFTQLYVAIFAATLLLPFLGGIKGRSLIPLILMIGVALWVHPKAPQVKNWVKWNYEGIEGKGTWPVLQEIHNFLRDSGNGRVVYEHSPENNAFGTTRVFENLEYSSGRYTLEGLLKESSVTASFVYYIQSEVGQVCTAQIHGYRYSHLNLRSVIPRLNLFNVTHYIARSPQAKAEARTIPELKLEKSAGAIEIFRVTSTDGHYVVPLAYEPFLFKTQNWRKDFYNWFVNPYLLDIPLVYEPEPDAKDMARLPRQSDSFLSLSKVPLDISKADVQEKIGPEDVEFTTNLIGHPHLIRVSYHPNWRVTGADRIYLVSPSFMLVYPTESRVKLHFGYGVPNYAGGLMSLAGLAIILVPRVRGLRRRPTPDAN